MKTAVDEPVTLEFVDAAGKVIRHYSSADRPEPPDPATAPVPLYWYRPPQRLSAAPGMHRFTWDLHYQAIDGAPSGGRGGLPIAAVPHNTVPVPSTPWVPAGSYTVRLAAGGKTYTQPLTVKMDPRVKTPALGLQQQFTLSKALYDGIAHLQAAIASSRDLKNQTAAIATRAATLPPEATQALADFGTRLDALVGRPPAGFGGGRGGAPQGPETLNSLSAGLAQLMGILQEADVTPTAALVTSVGERRAAIAPLLAKWDALKGAELTNLNAKLKAANLPPITVTNAKTPSAGL